ncbi:hypothetical protein HPB52_013200 [Rhipicephalus sanguineus]|uniref:Uncharacterized protein n=1 Tax=Rhipicephalus sanguineus TaxID=34632 RepID=A0A9D4T211_RHISA|nr:hypothetical protein HPB52_013199 [Rhipicephalus sanguineus]KAH7968956.1 hypothetical protein HPB52_013200 [Rhipicephalus sanguineus]
MWQRSSTAHQWVGPPSSQVRRMRWWKSPSSGPQPDGSLPLPVDAVIGGAVSSPSTTTTPSRGLSKSHAGRLVARSACRPAPARWTPSEPGYKRPTSSRSAP